MTNEKLIAEIRQEIERRITDNTFGAKLELIDILAWLDTLESEKPINPDAAMKELDEKIALVKQSGTWDGVDVDEYMDEVRGRAPEKPINQEDELNGEIKKFVAEYGYERSEDILLIAIVARHFAEWGYLRAAEKYNEIEYNRQRAEEDTPNDLEEAANKFAVFYDQGTCDGIAQDCFIAGAKWQAEQLLKSSPLPEDTVLFNKGVEEGKRLMMEEAVEADVMLTLHDKTGDISLHTGYLPKELGIKCDDKVKIIIVKED